jgi:hypothetical protein
MIHIYTKGNSFTFKNGYWLVQQGCFIKQRYQVYNDTYLNQALYCQGDYYDASIPYSDPYRCFPLNQVELIKVDCIDYHQLSMQLEHQQDLAYILNCKLNDEERTQSRLYLFIKWLKSKGISYESQLLSQEQMSNFISCQRQFVNRELMNLKKLNMI